LTKAKYKKISGRASNRSKSLNGSRKSSLTSRTDDENIKLNNYGVCEDNSNYIKLNFDHLFSYLVDNKQI